MKTAYRKAARQKRDLLREQMLPRRNGTTFDVYTCLERDWYQDRGDVKRWAENGQPMEHAAHGPQ